MPVVVNKLIFPSVSSLWNWEIMMHICITENNAYGELCFVGKYLIESVRIGINIQLLDIETSGAAFEFRLIYVRMRDISSTY